MMCQKLFKICHADGIAVAMTLLSRAIGTVEAFSLFFAHGNGTAVCPHCRQHILKYTNEILVREFCMPDVKTSSYFYPKNIDQKIEGYKSQDRRAERLLDNYITKTEVVELFTKQKFVCYY